MHRRRGLFVAVVVAATAVSLVPGLVEAGSQGGALQNVTSGTVKLVHTGGSQPSPSWSDLGRLVLPVGSVVVDACTTLESRAGSATGVECALRLPNGSGEAMTSLGAQKGTNVGGLAIEAAVNAPDGGPAELLCRLTSAAADRLVQAYDTSIIAIAVAGATVTHRSAPPAASVF